MGLVKKSISVTPKQNEWIKKQIDSGNYGNDSELTRQLIREKQAAEQQNDTSIHYIREKLIEAEKGGFSDKSSDQILRDIKSRLKSS